MKPQIYENVFRTTIVCIDDYDNKIPQGKIYNAYYEGGVSFCGVIDFLSNMEAMLEEMNYPQSFSSRRSFGSSAVKKTPDLSPDAVQEGKYATFSLRILFRQNASWQGSLYWHEGKEEESFRSVLELLLLIDSALRTKE